MSDWEFSSRKVFRNYFPCIATLLRIAKEFLKGDAEMFHFIWNHALNVSCLVAVLNKL